MDLKMDFAQINQISLKINKTHPIRMNHKEGFRKHNEVDIKFDPNSFKSNDLKVECRALNSDPRNNLLNCLI